MPMSDSGVYLDLKLCVLKIPLSDYVKKVKKSAHKMLMSNKEKMALFILVENYIELSYDLPLAELDILQDFQ